MAVFFRARAPEADSRAPGSKEIPVGAELKGMRRPSFREFATLIGLRAGEKAWINGVALPLVSVLSDPDFSLGKSQISDTLNHKDKTIFDITDGHLLEVSMLTASAFGIAFAAALKNVYKEMSRTAQVLLSLGSFFVGADGIIHPPKERKIGKASLHDITIGLGFAFVVAGQLKLARDLSKSNDKEVRELGSITRAAALGSISTSIRGFLHDHRVLAKWEFMPIAITGAWMSHMAKDAHVRFIRKLEKMQVKVA